MITLPDGKICNNLPEQVAKNAKDIFEVAQQWQPYKEELEADFEILATYLADMSSAAVGAIAGQDIAPANVNATTKVSAPLILETMTGYSFTQGAAVTGITLNFSYVGVSKTGNKLTVVLAGDVTKTDNNANSFALGDVYIPSAIGALLYPYSLSPFTNIIANVAAQCWPDYDVNNKKDISILFRKYANNYINIVGYTAPLTLNTTYIFRIEQTFLLSDNLAS